jgi:isochorismate synthase
VTHGASDPPAGTSRVRASRLPPAFDLLATCSGEGAGAFLFERDGLGVAAAPEASELAGRSGFETVEGAGEVAIAELGRAILTRLRRSEPTRGAPAAVAVGRFPFGALDAGWMDTPARVVRHTEQGQTWLFERSAGREADPFVGTQPFAPQRPRAGSPGEAFEPGQVRSHPSPDEYAAMVGMARERIRGGELRKVVLARTVEVSAGRTLDPLRLAQRLRAVDPGAYAFIAAKVPDDPEPARGSAPVLVGASPELLISRMGSRVRSTPLAGSAPRSGDADRDRANADGLLASAKDREEHAIVVESIAEVLGPLCDRLDHDLEPVLLETANVWHLATRFDGVLRDPAPTAVDLVAALHPTPAVCGTPRGRALELIAQLEPFDRGGYAGPVGWMDANGDGEWAIALRCAELRGERATLFAGAGIVGASEPAAEVAETDRKFRAFLDSLRWG